MRHGEIILAEYTSNTNDMLKVDANGKIVVSTLNESDVATVSLVATISGAIITDHGALGGLGDDDHTQYSLASGTRAFTGTVSGVTPTLAAHLTTKNYVDTKVYPHSGLSGLTNDDHTQYSLVTGTRAFTGTIGGVTPTAAAHLTTKNYVDTKVYSHAGLSGLGNDDHTQYSLVNGTRAFTGVVGGVTPTLSTHLTTKGYVDGLAASQFVSFTTPVNNSSLTDVLLTGITITPGAGTYIVLFSTVYGSSSNVDVITTFSIYANNVVVTDSIRECFTTDADDRRPVSLITKVTVAAAQAIEVRWKVDAHTSTANRASLTLIKVAS